MGEDQPDADNDRPWIVLHDKTDHGGFVITASENTSIDDRRVARIGDMVSCPRPGHGINPIVTGSDCVTLDGRRVARHGDRAACGCRLLSSQIASASE
ncbi:PAAR domain-containing protein [Variovorax sp. RO1]|uniref:PAAR domain-containing protein n=1 Tax=Variovorax paradoxus TaxID=34073 RepID=A0A5Q0M1S0_VARPD|nr:MULTISPECIES: PAAR domain-containing protein [Variovorax]PIF75589.1 putative Zn-binding protein involved in type VI secretion [Variovorax sp. 54]PLC01417.1 PAAR domain-containing protein [Variovorax sp. RO1]QFZ82777.1 PAAR domain-containing protein [Variovorax paradoxus]QOF78349.1 PAAR domain-containing protein [Variovorax sp. 38R]WPG37519.1 PAAR domain-containing protein [Variovorax boronicumulans]